MTDSPGVWWAGLRRDWPPRVAGLLILLGIVGLWWFARDLSLGVWVTITACLVLLVAILWRRDWIRLCGPILAYDLVNHARRRHPAFLRGLYALLLLVVLFLLYWNTFETRTRSLAEFLLGGRLPPREMAQFAEAFFYTFMGVQGLIVFLLTPIYTAGTIAAERERRSLDFILVTDLRNHEIVVGLLISRLGHLLLIAITGLPVLALLQFLGGVDPQLLVAGFLATAVSMASLGALGMVLSVYSRRPLDAIMGTYCFAALFLTLTWCVPGVRAGNPFSAMYELGFFGGPSDPTVDLETVLPDVVGRYVGFHVIAAIGLALWASWQLRRAARRSAAPVDKPKAKPMRVRVRPEMAAASTRARLPAIGDRPVLWKEMHIGPEPVMRGWHPITHVIVIGATIGWIFISIFVGITQSLRPRGGMEMSAIREGVTYSTLMLAIPLGCILLLLVAFRAAGTVCREREQSTLDSLLMTPLETVAILQEKWAASILGQRLLWLIFIGLWAVAGLAGSLRLATCALMVVAWLVFAFFLASLGLYFSVKHTAFQGALMSTIIVVIALCIVPPLVAIPLETLLSWVSPNLGRAISEFFGVGLSPLGILLILWDYFEGAHHSRYAVYGAFAGLIGYAAAALFLWKLAQERFEQMCGRADRPPPRQSFLARRARRA